MLKFQSNKRQQRLIIAKLPLRVRTLSFLRTRLKAIINREPQSRSKRAAFQTTKTNKARIRRKRRLRFCKKSLLWVTVNWRRLHRLLPTVVRSPLKAKTLLLMVIRAVKASESHKGSIRWITLGAHCILTIKILWWMRLQGRSIKKVISWRNKVKDNKLITVESKGQLSPFATITKLPVLDLIMG